MHPIGWSVLPAHLNRRRRPHETPEIRGEYAEIQAHDQPEFPRPSKTIPKKRHGMYTKSARKTGELEGRDRSRRSPDGTGHHSLSDVLLRAKLVRRVKQPKTKATILG